MSKQKIIFIVGPTAVGKSQVAMSLARQVNGELISCDAMQVYKEINIASDKATPQMLEEVPHHLVNVISVTDEFDVKRFNELANDALADIHARGKLPIVVGGSGMYMSILLDGLFQGQEADPTFRARMDEVIERDGLESLFIRLQEVDPKAAEKIHPNDKRRIVRVLEVFDKDGVPMSEMQQQREGWWGSFDIKMYGLNREREAMYQHINDRVDEMFANGMVGEIKALNDLSWSKTSDRLIGIQEVKALLAGECSEEEAKDTIKQKTRKFAKRQVTWFRHEDRIEWIDMDSSSIDQVVDKIKESC